MPRMIRGVKICHGHVDKAGQEQLVNAIRHVARTAPLFSPMTPYGKPMSVRMTSAGRYGWYSDRSGYRYVECHPDGTQWPDIPGSILKIWNKFVSGDRRPDCCLINYYGHNCRMGMHRDCDEKDFSWPVVSISLGDRARFRVGNLHRGGPTESVWLESGDVAVLGGEARLIYHGIDCIRFGSSPLLPDGGRINLTMRVID